MANGDDMDFPIAELLAAPVRAIQEAQIAAEREFVQFFVDYGLEPIERRIAGRRTKAFRLRNVEFEVPRSVPDPVNPGKVVDRTAIVSAPLVSMINMPAIAIDEATINLALDVSAERVEPEPVATRRTAATQVAQPSPLPERQASSVRLKGNVGSKVATRSPLVSKGRLEITLKLVSSREQRSLDRLTALMGESLSAKIVEG